MKVSFTEMLERAEKIDGFIREDLSESTVKHLIERGDGWFTVSDLISLGRSAFWWYAQARGGFPSWHIKGVGFCAKKHNVEAWLIRLGADRSKLETVQPA